MDKYNKFFREHPIEYIEQTFNEKLWSKQKDVVLSVRDNRFTSVRSCHDTGKSFIAARIVLWFLYTHPNSKVITTAPTFIQVANILWREIRSAKNKMIIQVPGQMNETELSIDEQWFALGISTNEPERFQGYHAPDILLIVDEASGVSQEIFDASQGIVSSQNARVLYIGNPTSVEGEFYKSFNLETTSKIKISAFDTPNFTKFGITLEDIKNNTWQEKITEELPAPYLITPEWVYDKLIRWGEDTPMWDARVVGDFPQQEEDRLIPLVKIEAAMMRTIVPQEDDPEQIGADISRFGGDKTIFCVRKGATVKELKEYNNSDTMTTALRLYDFWRFHPFAEMCIDVIGIGAGVVDRVRQLEDKKVVYGINIGLPSNEPERFLNLRAEYYWNLRERFVNDDIDIPNDDDLAAQLSNLKFVYTPKGQIKIEAKEDMKKRGLPSPDKADALALAYGRITPKSGMLEFMKETYAN